MKWKDESLCVAYSNSIVTMGNENHLHRHGRDSCSALLSFKASMTGEEAKPVMKGRICRHFRESRDTEKALLTTEVIRKGFKTRTYNDYMLAMVTTDFFI